MGGTGATSAPPYPADPNTCFIIPDRLCWLPQGAATTKAALQHKRGDSGTSLSYENGPDSLSSKKDRNNLYVDIPEARQYKRFFADFGPPCLSTVVSFWRRLKAILSSPEHSAFGICTYSLLVTDAVRGMARAVSARYLDPDTFDVESYTTMSRMENGDMNWVVPGKLLAFSGPLACSRAIEVEEGGVGTTWIVENYAHAFRHMGITDVIRFNKKCYDRKVLCKAGIRHHDLYYQDGSNPPRHIMDQFLRICEGSQGAVAVHCKAGLGRTGTNIAMWLMKHAGFSAPEATAWCRVCRPGSIVGPQQHFVESYENEMRGGYRASQSGGAKTESKTTKSPMFPNNPLSARLHRRRSSSQSTASTWSASSVETTADTDDLYSSSSSRRVSSDPPRRPEYPPRQRSVLGLR